MQVISQAFDSYQFKMLTEKIPTAYIQSGWTENDFRNLTAKVWAILDNPIKSYDFFLIKFMYMYAAFQVALC